MATHYTILSWEISWTEKPGRLQSMGVMKIQMHLVTKQKQTHYSYYDIVTIWLNIVTIT